MMNNENGLGRIMGGVNGAIVETYNNRPFYLMSSFIIPKLTINVYQEFQNLEELHTWVKEKTAP